MSTINLTNLISNALFASTSGWVNYDSISGGVLTDTGSGWTGCGSSVSMQDTASHKYYFAVNCKTTNVASSAAFGVGLTSGGGYVYAGNLARVTVILTTGVKYWRVRGVLR